MKAIQIKSHGGPEVLVTSTVSDPKPASGEVLVRIRAAAVNPFDSAIRMGHFAAAKKPPLVLGQEGAGVVERGAGGFREGERVIVCGGGLGVFRDGTWAEFVAVPPSGVRRLPEGISFEEGAAVPVAGVTALGALRTAELRAGETLVVLGATGGVGSAGVQIGRALGGRVIAVAATPEKRARITDLRADHIVVLTEGPLADQVLKLTGGKGADVVLDPVGGELTGRALAALGSFGRLVHLGYRAGTALTLNSFDLIGKGSRIIGFSIFWVPPDRAAREFDEVVAFLARRQYRPLMDRTFPLEDVVEATAHLDARKGAGKVVLTV